MSENKGNLGKVGKDNGKNVQEIMVETRHKKGPVHDILEREKSDMIDELETSKVQRMLEEEKQKIKSIQQQNQPIPQNQAQNFVQMMLAGRSGIEIKEILDILGPEHIQKLAMMGAAMTPGSFVGLENFMRQPSTSGKDIVDAVRTGAELSKGQSSTGSAGSVSEIAKSMAEMFKAGVEAAKAQSSASPQTNVYHELVKSTLDELKATREEMARQDRMKLEREIAEIKNRPSAMEEIARDAEKYTTYRKVFGGTDSATANEYTLKKLEMEQTERLEDRKIGFEENKWQYEKAHEEKKWEYEKAHEGDTLNTVKELMAGPVGEVVKSIGQAGADKLRGQKGNTSNSANLVQVQCPQCKGIFMANGTLPMVMCPLCGAQLKAAPQQTEPQVTSTPQTEVTQQQSSGEASVEQQKPTSQV